MINRRLVALSLCCALFLLVSSCATTGNSENCTLKGVVLNQKCGRPVAGITVALGVVSKPYGGEKTVVPYGGGQPYVTTTGRDGTFRFRNLKPGPLLVMIQDAKTACVEGEVPIELVEGENRKDVTLHVGLGASISGTIYNDGYYHGVEGVKVQVVPSSDQRKEWIRTYEAVTNADGTFRIGGIPSGYYEIESSPLDKFEQTSICFYGETPMAASHTPFMGVELDWGTHYEPFEFTVAPGALARGVVVDEAGQPVAGAEVYLATRRGANVLTDERGEFTLPNWESSKFPDLQARKGNARSDILTSEKSIDEYGPIRLVLHPKASILIRLVGEDGVTLSGISPAYVSLDVLANGGKSMGGEAKDIVDSCTYDWLLPDVEYQITVNGNEGLEVLNSPQTITTEAGKQTEVIFTARKIDIMQGPRIVGQIVDVEGNPVADAVLSEESSGSYQTRSNADGTFDFKTRTIPKSQEGMASPVSRDYTLRVAASGFETLTVTLRPGEASAAIELERVGIIRGQVVDASTGAEVEDYTVTVYKPEATNKPGGSGRKLLTSARFEKLPSGHFIIKGVAISPVLLEVSSPSYEVAHTTLAFAPRLEEGVANFRLQRRARTLE